MVFKIAGYSIILLSLLLISSCGDVYQINLKSSGSGKTAIIVTKSDVKMPLFQVDFIGSSDEAAAASALIKQILTACRQINGSIALPEDTVYLESDTNYYRLFFQFGTAALSDWKNEVLKYGWLQSQWLSLLNGSGGGKGILKRMFQSEPLSDIRIDDIRSYFHSNSLAVNEEPDIYPYAVNYLLREIYFVSIQEILSRPSRYLTVREIDDTFCQMVMLPEVTEFTRYVNKKFGAQKLAEAGREEYSKEGWKKLFGEEMHDTEGDFSKNIEKRSYSGRFADHDFTEKLDDLFKVMNKMTKPTLFKK